MRLIRLFLFALLSAAAFMPPAQAAHAETWSYDNEDDWATLDKHYAACAGGMQQSPVEIITAVKKDLPPLGVRYSTSTATLRRQDYTLIVDVGGGSTLQDNGETYQLTQIRFHTPSEHVVTGRFWPLEIQLMHRNAQGKQLIVAVLANIGAGNTALEILLNHVADQSPTPPVIRFDPNNFLPANQGYYAYTGSLTIPPCTEGIEWRVFKKPVTVSEGQLTALEKITGRNARLPQPVYMRTVLESDE